MSEDLLQKRVELLKRTARFEKTERVATSSNVWTWKILDSDTKAKIMDACLDLTLMEKIVREFHERYMFDMYEDLGTRNFFCASEPLGNPGYIVDDETGAINVPDLCLLNEDEYDEIIADTVMFGWTKVLPRKFGNFTYEQYGQAVQGFMKFTSYVSGIAARFVEDYGVPRLKGNMQFCPVEDLFSWGLRGIKHFSSDMRRIPEKVDAYIDAFESSRVEAFRPSLIKKDPNAIFDVYSVALAHSCMNMKQFDRFYYRTIKRFIDITLEYDGLMTFQWEDSFLRFADFFKDVPKGCLNVSIEQDDVLQVRKECPNISIRGGMPTSMLGSCTPEECVDYAKKVIDEMGEGLYLSQNKMVSFRNDCLRDNLLAVQQFALNYKL